MQAEQMLNRFLGNAEQILKTKCSYSSQAEQMLRYIMHKTKCSFNRQAEQMRSKFLGNDEQMLKTKCSYSMQAEQNFCRYTATIKSRIMVVNLHKLSQ